MRQRQQLNLQGTLRYAPRQERLVHLAVSNKVRQETV